MTKIEKLIKRHKFDSFGIIDSHASKQEEEKFKKWLKKGYGNGMPYLHKHSFLKADPEKLLNGCKSIIVLLLNYFQEKKAPEKEEGVVSRYAYGRDYHKVFSSKLKKIKNELLTIYPNEEFRIGSDTLPILEKYYAEQAGQGFVGKNTLLINKIFGSWIVIGEILSTKRFPSTTADNYIKRKCPETCTKCIDACPTGALKEPYIIDSTKCITYFNIENKGIIPEKLRSSIGNHIYGCDICQEVCPLNKSVVQTKHEDFIKHIAGQSLRLDEVLKIKDDNEFRAKFAGSPLIRLKRERLIRNASIVAGNSGLYELNSILRKLTKDQNSIISEHSTWALNKISKNEKIKKNNI